jgi:hypothetical protein
MRQRRLVFDCEPARMPTLRDGEPAADPTIRKRASARVQGRGFSGFRTAQVLDPVMRRRTPSPIPGRDRLTRVPDMRRSAGDRGPR